MLKAKEVFVTHGPWLVHGALEKLKVFLLLLPWNPIFFKNEDLFLWGVLKKVNK